MTKTKTLGIVMLLLFFLSYSSLAYQYREYLNNPVIPESLPSVGQLVTDLSSAAALGADIVGAAIPGVTGLGLMVRGAAKVDDVAKVARGADKVKDTVKAADKGRDTVRAVDKGKDVQKVSIDNLWGHETTDAARLFREGAKSHRTNPIEVIKIGDEYLIDDGVGRSMRALKEGDSFVNANVALDRSYKSVEQLKSLAAEGYEKAKMDLKWWEKSTKIVDAKRWKGLK